MIVRAGDAGSANLRVIDTMTGEDLKCCTEVNTETGEALRVAFDADGRLQVKDGAVVIEKCPNPVRVIERGGVEDRMLSRIQEDLHAAGKRYRALLGAFVLGLNPDCTASTFPLDLGPRCGAWEVTFTRKAWGAEEGHQ